MRRGLEFNWNSKLEKSLSKFIELLDWNFFLNSEPGFFIFFFHFDVLVQLCQM